jgi:DNA-binding transcriptional LysR family regulator
MALIQSILKMHNLHDQHALYFVMNPSDLHTFLAVGRRLSYTRAARELYLSQPAVSRRVHRLEEELGVELLEQIGKKLHLTTAGRTLVKEGEQLLGSIERVAEAVRAHHGGRQGSLRLGASTTPGFYLLPAILGRFTAASPAVELSFGIENSRRIEEKILRNELDLGFVGARLASDEVEHEELAEDEIVLFAAGAHPLARRSRLDLRALEGEIWVMREPRSATRRLVEERLAASGVRPARTITLGCPEAVKAVVRGGTGISFLSLAGLRDDFRAGRLRRLPVTGFRLRRPLYIARHRDKPIGPAMAAFLELARRMAKRRRRN